MIPSIRKWRFDACSLGTSYLKRRWIRNVGAHTILILLLEQIVREIPVLSFPLSSIFSSGISMLLISRDELVDKMNSEARNCIFHQDITLTDPNIYSFFCKTLDRIILLQHFTLCSLQVNLFNSFHFLKNFSSRQSKILKLPWNDQLFINHIQSLHCW